MRARNSAAAIFADCLPLAAEAEAFSRPQPMDEAAFRGFYEETAPVLWSYIRRSSGDAALADDILQETFYRFLRAGLPPMENAQRKAYLYRTASSLLADHWRRLKRERRWSFDSWLGRTASEELASRGDAMDLFARLKPQQQSLLWLAYVEGFDHREIASTLQLREKSVRVLLFRARKSLARLLSNQGIGPAEEGI
jgi:RNA polymerase sigma-70 factor (ECF subfamily)